MIKNDNIENDDIKITILNRQEYMDLIKKYNPIWKHEKNRLQLNKRINNI